MSITLCAFVIQTFVFSWLVGTRSQLTYVIVYDFVSCVFLYMTLSAVSLSAVYAYQGF